MHTFLDSDSGRSLIKASAPCQILCAATDFLITQLAQRRAGKPHGLIHTHHLSHGGHWHQVPVREQCEGCPASASTRSASQEPLREWPSTSPGRFMQILHQWESDALRLPPASPRSSAGSGFRGSPPRYAAGAAAPDRQRRLPKRTSTGPT